MITIRMYAFELFALKINTTFRFSSFLRLWTVGTTLVSDTQNPEILGFLNVALFCNADQAIQGV